VAAVKPGDQLACDVDGLTPITLRIGTGDEVASTPKA
jgi:hypothetical protein